MQATRFAHEMNIADSPWWVGHIGAQPSLSIAVWRRVPSLFEAEGATNGEWVWSPNYASHPPEPWNDLQAYYPGDPYVDWIGLSGDNWYTSRPDGIWRTFSDLYDPVLRDLACAYPKPQIIAEMGSVEGDRPNRSKAAWIRGAYAQALRHPFLRAIQWFNDYAYADPREADFRVTTSSAQDGDVVALGDWTIAYRQALADPVYTTTLPSRAAATPPGRYCEGPPLAVAPSVLLMTSTASVALRLTGIDYTAPVSISLALPSDFGGPSNPGMLDPPWGAAVIALQAVGAPPGAYPVTVTVQGPDAVWRLPVQVYGVDRVHRIRIPRVMK